MNKLFDPFSQQQFFLGGLLDNVNLGKGFTPSSGASGAGMVGGLLSGLIPTTKKDGSTSIGGSAASGALSGAASGAMFGPIGMIGGGLFGGVSKLLSAKKDQEQLLQQQQEQQDQITSSTMGNLNSVFSNGSNLPMAYGGQMENSSEVPIGDYSHFGNGGTHEQNPNGGIPQGQNAQGQQRTVEEGEGKFKFTDGDYIFSNRLKFE